MYLVYIIIIIYKIQVELQHKLEKCKEELETSYQKKVNCFSQYHSPTNTLFCTVRL